MNSVNNSPSFSGKLKLKNVEEFSDTLKTMVLENKTLQRLAQNSDKDIIIFNSTKIAKDAKGYHSYGDTLNKLSVYKENDSFLAKVKRFFGIGKVNLSRNHHSDTAIMYHVLPNISLAKLEKKL